MKKIYSYLNNKKGAISILFVILSLIAVIIISAFIDITTKMFSINEIQGVLDDAGVSALHMGVDDNYWRLEELKINETQVLNHFYKMVDETISAGGDSVLVDYQVMAKVIPPNDSRLKQLGIPRGQRDQYFLVSEAYARYKTYNFLDKLAMANLDFFNFFDGREDAIRYNGVTDDGNAEIVVRSVVRLVLR